MKKGNKSYKLIIDSNVWISFLIGKHLKGLHNIITSGKVQVVSCHEQIAELYEVFHREKMQKHFNSTQVIEFFELLDDCAYFQEISTQSKLCRDPKDNYLLSLAIDSKADYLITGDNDLLILGKIENTLIVSYTAFHKIIY